MLFNTRDLRDAVMCRGKIVEQGGTAAVSAHPQPEYARTLLDSIPGRNWPPPVLRQDTPQCPRRGV